MKKHAFKKTYKKVNSKSLRHVGYNFTSSQLRLISRKLHSGSLSSTSQTSLAVSQVIHLSTCPVPTEKGYILSECCQEI